MRGYPAALARFDPVDYRRLTSFRVGGFHRARYHVWMGGPPARATLTPREREVLDLVGQGMSNEEIGRRLHITRQTAQLHATSGIRKLVRRLRVADDDGMTRRERDVIELLREGLSDHQIAQRLNIGVRSAESYVTRVLRKVGHSRAELRPTQRDPDVHGLSRREREVADLLSRGLTDRAIAEQFDISIRTAESHVAAVLRKLGLTSRQQMQG